MPNPLFPNLSVGDVLKIATIVFALGGAWYKLSSVESAAAETRERLASAEMAIGSLERDLALDEARIAVVEKQVDPLREDVDSIKELLIRLDANVKTILERLDKLEDRQ